MTSLNFRLHILILLLFSFSISSFGIDPTKPTAEKESLIRSIRAPRTVTPGGFETFILELSNEYQFTLNYNVGIILPDTWSVISKEDRISLEPEEQKQVIFLIAIDKQCNTGEKNITFSFEDPENEINIVESVITSVEDIHKISLEVVRQPLRVVAGEQYEIDFEIFNQGNCREVVYLFSSNGEYRGDSIELFSNGSEIITLHADAQLEVNNVTRAITRLEVQTNYQKEMIRASSNVKVYPKSTYKSDDYVRLPIEISATYFVVRNSEPITGGIQIEAKGKGFIDSKERQEIDFVARGPDRFQVSRFGNFDQYSLGYSVKLKSDRKIAIRLGDYSYRLTELTESFRWARGAGIDFIGTKWEYGAFVNKPRFIGGIDGQLASHITYKPNERLRISANSLQRKLTGDDELVNLFSGQTTYKSSKISLESELGVSQKGNLRGFAGRLMLQGRKGKLSYGTNTIAAGANYFGYYNNSFFTSTNASYQFKKWSIDASIFYNLTNLAQDTLFSVAPYSINNIAGVSFYPSKGQRIQISYINRFREDQFPTKRFSFRENTVRAVYNLRRKTWRLRARAELGETQNLLLAADDNAQLTYNTTVSFDRTFSLKFQGGAFAQYLYTNRYDQSLTSVLLYGVNFSYQPTERLRMYTILRNNYLLDQVASDRALADFGASYRVGHHGFDFSYSSAILRNTIDRVDFFANIKYTYRFNAPISKKKGVYSLTGQVQAVNKEDAGGIVLTISGQNVITDEFGRFIVNNLTEGIHYIYIDRSTLGPGLIPTDEIPIPVEIDRESNNTIRIPIVKASKIRGKINFIMDDYSKRTGMKPPIKVIKATSNGIEKLVYTDPEGNYEFWNLTPGEWTIRVVKGKTTADWSLVENNKVVVIQENAIEIINFEMKLKERKIKFQNEPLDLNID